MEQSGKKKLLECAYIPNNKNVLGGGGGYLRQKLHVRVVINYADMQFLTFKIKFLRENEKGR